jgi:hypothetical protein
MAQLFANLANHLVFLLHCFCNDLSKITQFGALAGQIQHMAAQKVGFTLHPIRYGHPHWHSSGAAPPVLSLKSAR